MRLWRAAWVLPVAAAPIRDGAVLVRGGEIAAVGPAADVLANSPGVPVRDLGRSILCPGLVDAHCHLEWSLLDGILPPAEFAEWLGRPQRRWALARCLLYPSPRPRDRQKSRMPSSA